MKIYDFVELISSLDYLEKQGIHKESKGTIIELKNNNAFVVFFNEKNMGNYAFANVETKFLKTIGEFPKEHIDKLNTFIKDLDYALYTVFYRDEDKSSLWDKEIPLWPMVYHGIIHYNMSTDTVNANTITTTKIVSATTWRLSGQLILPHSSFTDFM